VDAELAAVACHHSQLLGLTTFRVTAGLIKGRYVDSDPLLVPPIVRLTELTGGRVESRFARLLLKLADQMGRPDAARGGIVVAMPMSRQELADLTGTTIETATRIMSRWNKDDVLRTDRNAFVILDVETLKTAKS